MDSKKREEADVNEEDQGYINEFSRLYTKNKKIDAELKNVKEILNSLEDADAAIDESMGSGLILSVGETFVETTEDQAKEYVEKMRKKYNDNQMSLMGKFDENKKRLDELKIILYTKFGKRLRLEED